MRLTVPRRLPVPLMYHGFTADDRADDPYFLFVTGKAFADQLDHLHHRGWDALDLSEFLRRRANPKLGSPSFLITIDDGFVSVLDIAAPILRARNVPAILFVPAAMVGGRTSWMTDMPDEQLLDADGLRALGEYGIEVGVHGFDHADMVGMTETMLRRQTVDARATIADITGVSPRSFAYPSGAYDQLALRAVADAGFEVAFSTVRGSGGHAIPRIEVHSRDSLRLIDLKLLPGYRRVWRMGERVKPARAYARRLLERRSTAPLA